MIPATPSSLPDIISPGTAAASANRPLPISGRILDDYRREALDAMLDLVASLTGLTNSRGLFGAITDDKIAELQARCEFYDRIRHRLCPTAAPIALNPLLGGPAMTPNTALAEARRHLVIRLLTEVAAQGYFHCPACNTPVEPDGRCWCGAANPLTEENLVPRV